MRPPRLLNKAEYNLNQRNLRHHNGSGSGSVGRGKVLSMWGNGTTCQANGVTNADLVVFGQISKIDIEDATFGYNVIPIKITPSSSGPSTAAAVPMSNATQ